MQLEPHVEALERQLTDLASLGDEAAATAAQRLIQLLGTPVRIRMLELVGEAALEVSGQLPSGHIEVRLAGPDPSLVFVPDQDEAANVSPTADDSAARLTLRMPEALKASVEDAATRDGISVNAWLVRAIARQLSAPSARPQRQIGKRITGYGRS